MKTIEERAKEYAPETFLSALKRKAYIAGAQEQKVIDDAVLLKLKSSWERQAQINHDDEANYKQGYHDAIEKAKNAFNKTCGWLSTFLWYNGVFEEFIKALEE